MMRLLRAELTRARYRRLPKVLLSLMLLIVAIAGVVTFIRAETVAEARATLPQRFEAEVRSCVEFSQQAFSDDESVSDRPEEKLAAQRAAVEATCRENVQVTETGRTSRLEQLWNDNGSGGLQLLLTFGTMAAFLLGASLIGAEWRAGTMTTTLLWENRRILLAVAKTAAAVITAWVVLLLASLWMVLAFLPAALKSGTGGVPWSFVTGYSDEFAIQLLVAGLAAVAGVAIGFIGRNTAAALGAGFVFTAIVEPLALVWLSDWRWWFMGPNVEALVQGAPADGSAGTPARWALARLCAYAGALLAVTLVLFRRRDVAGSS